MNAPVVTVRTSGWADLPAVTEVWAAAGSQVVLGTFDGRRGWIHRLAVSPGHRRAGLATALVAELEERFRSLGVPRVNLLVLPDNAAGLASWQRLGHLPCPDVLWSKPLDGVAPTVSG